MTLFPEWQAARAAKESARLKAERKAARQTPPARFPITEPQAKALKALNGCNFGVGSVAKRFVHDLQGATELTEKQGRYLAELVRRYRRQLHLNDDQANAWKNSLLEDARHPAPQPEATDAHEDGTAP